MAELSVEELQYLSFIANWRKTTKDRPGQRWKRNDSSWNTWLILAGRGWGKTRTGSQWVSEHAMADKNQIIGVVAPTHAMLMNVCFEGESGILARLPKLLIADYVKSPTPTITLINGSQIQGFSAQDPERLRGIQWHGCWCDEFGAWDYPTMSMNMVKMCNRLGQHPQLLITTTPKPLKIFRNIMDDEKTRITRGNTYENRKNLAPTFFDEIVKFEGTQIGRQEIYGELLDMEESGIFKRSWLNVWPCKQEQPGVPWKLRTKLPFPKLYYVLQSYDTAFTERTMNDPTAMTCWGVFRPKTDGPFALMLLDAWRDWLQYPDLRIKAFDEWGMAYGENEKTVDLVLIEDKGSGITLRQEMHRAGIPCVPYNPGAADKIQRAHAASPYVKQGFLWMPESSKVEGTVRAWADPFVSEFCSFGPATYAAMLKNKNKAQELMFNKKEAADGKAADDGAEHDDYVDTATQAIAWFRDSEWIRMPKDPGWDHVDEELEREVNPYAQ